ncbi:hypothetical protein O181_044109 [Austropuccinia psidii MF-1]|uniref:Zinc/iron permease n=1 Tax=Austropuccinia psidii MF-1 TaxID=1389203 RepID=A0A9Q3DJD8_9BASI|nr:hypothetical protein [Austropuccinia psidii MF-1]
MPFIQLAILSSIMFITTFLIGSLPLSLSNNLNPIRFHQLSIFGVGLLVGAALSIVIPEGIDAIYNSDPTIDPSSSSISQIHHRAHYHHNSQVGLTLMAGFILMFLIHQLTTSSQIKSKKKPAQSSNSKSDPSQTQALLSQPWNDDGLALKLDLLIRVETRFQRKLIQAASQITIINLKLRTNRLVLTRFQLS